MKKRTLNAEQIAARDARREKFRAITKAVAAMTDEQRAALVPSFGAVPTCEGRTLSLKNTMLAIMQRPGVSMVGGFRQWIANGRAVRKGEHGIMIWIPLGLGSGDAPDGEASEQRFGTATVFDVAQTDVLETGNQELARDERAGHVDLPIDGEAHALITGSPASSGSVALEVMPEDAPIAVVSPEVADAFGMRGLPNVRIVESDEPVIEGWITTKPKAAKDCGQLALL